MKVQNMISYCLWKSIESIHFIRQGNEKKSVNSAFPYIYVMVNLTNIQLAKRRNLFYRRIIYTSKQDITHYTDAHSTYQSYTTTTSTHISNTSETFYFGVNCSQQTSKVQNKHISTVDISGQNKDGRARAADCQSLIFRPIHSSGWLVTKSHA